MFRMEEFSFENIRRLKLILIETFTSHLPNQFLKTDIQITFQRTFRITETTLTYSTLLKNKLNLIRKRQLNVADLF